MTKEQEDLIVDNLKLVYKALQRKNMNTEDMRSEATLRLCESIDKFDPNKGEFSTFVYMVVETTIKRYFRENDALKRKIHNEYLYSLDKEMYEDTDCYDFIEDDFHGIDDYETTEIINNIQMKEIEKKVFNMLILGYKQEEIAKVLKCTKQYISIIKKNLKEKIKEEMYGL